ncbi:Hint domain-containing protein [Microvirga pudoricolor]|uniref:Hint domain-containing protein n=1 Tax=Microvirga pudoricolor TaxID=2778729 RepID=UPI001950CEFD|nr:Hint domain-containing protein [Microvirga pudoricolor]MBM6594625.1 hypothetical protein [Microvirga pudoricolor]
MSEYKLSFDGYQVSLQQNGRVVDSWSAVSGRPGSQSPSETALKDVGPIPEGQWSFNTSDIQTVTGLDNIIGNIGKLSGVTLGEKFGAWYGGTVSWGVERAFLTPSATTNTFGRTGFSVHGGDWYGSAGCIDLGHEEVAFFSRISSLGISNITIDVKYDRQLLSKPHPLAGKFVWDPRPVDFWGRPLNHNNMPVNGVDQRNCFLADTMILMVDGTEKPIQDIRTGDEVMAFDPIADNGLTRKKAARVRRTFQNVTNKVLNLRGLHMTPGHLVLSDQGEWLKIIDVLRQDRMIVEERQGGPVLVRARTGAVCGSDDDAPITVLFTDKAGVPHKAVVRAGIICTAKRRSDGSLEGWSLAKVLRHQGYTIHSNGAIESSNGHRFEATPWPDGTPLDAPFQQDWVVSLDGRSFAPTWVAEILDREQAEIADAPVRTPYANFMTPPSKLNRRERRKLAARKLVS